MERNLRSDGWPYEKEEGLNLEIEGLPVNGTSGHCGTCHHERWKWEAGPFGRLTMDETDVRKRGCLLQIQP